MTNVTYTGIMPGELLLLTTLGDLPEGSMFEEFADRARRYMTEVDRLRVVLERLDRHLTTVSGSPVVECHHGSPNSNGSAC
jgi:hypothetical protein